MKFFVKANRKTTWFLSKIFYTLYNYYLKIRIVMFKLRRSFTLIEVTTAIVIVIVLSAAGWFLAAKFMKQWRDAKRYADANSIATALQGYYFRQKDYPDPSDKIEIFDQSGTLIWYQGIVDEQVVWNGLDITKLPIDPSDKNTYYSYVKAINPWENRKWYEVWTMIEDYRDKENGEQIYRGKYKTPYIISSNTISTCEQWDKLTYPSKITVMNYETNEYARKRNLASWKIMLDLLNLKWSCQWEVIANIIWLPWRTIPVPDVKTCSDWYYFNGEYCDDKCAAWVIRWKKYKQITYNYTGMILWQSWNFIWSPVENFTFLMRTYYAQIRCYEWNWEILKEWYVDSTKPQTVIINNYYSLVDTQKNAWSTSLNLNTVSGLSVWDEVLIIQMQHVTNAWVYEYKTISNIVWNQIQFLTWIVKTYYSNTFNSTTSNVTQVIRVPHYTDMIIPSTTTITAPAWNGSVWGIVVFKATWTVVITWNIDVRGKWFRNGLSWIHGNSEYGQYDWPKKAEQWESYCWRGTRVWDQKCGAGWWWYGGVYQVRWLAWWWGGAYATNWWDGQLYNSKTFPSVWYAWVGYWIQNLWQKIFLGAWWWGGGWHHEKGVYYWDDDGTWWGMVMIIADTFKLSWYIYANWYNGNYSQSYHCGGWWGWAGWAVYIKAITSLITTSWHIITNGWIGTPANSRYNSGAWWNGWVWRIHLASPSISWTTSPAAYTTTN